MGRDLIEEIFKDEEIMNKVVDNLLIAMEEFKLNWKHQMGNQE